ncbi:MAG: phosphoribosylamine--glycine ligase [Chloroflexi bacterium]|nr:phosphoribosylamine--glycine ligase [Chloroflexota bacterium]MCL5273837.1 phosphoribosylamine--glycine ligase [Chloroflexota bacterium]
MAQNKVLVIGSGGREHALAWALAKSPQVSQVIIAPGNAGTDHAADRTGKLLNVGIHSHDIQALLTYARSNGVDLTVVGPEAPLADGIVDEFMAAGLRIFGPTRAAAQLEASKAFAKSFMREHHIPTADYANFADYDEAAQWLRAYQKPVVVKADGLAAGKGVIMCHTPEEAHLALRRTMLEREFGDAGRTVVLEEFLTGPEVSLLAFSDGHTFVPMPPARDHKRINDHDQGPNTGGMGAYAPVPSVSPAVIEQICRTVMQPAIDGMAARGTPYKGVLYAGIMLTPDGPRTLEFNCRFGDPETQVILPLLQSDLFDILMACTTGRLAEIAPQIAWHSGACATVVLASPGYPGDYPKDLKIQGIEKANALQGVTVFHAGTAASDGQVVTAGGRVLAVSAVGHDLTGALNRAYEGVHHIEFSGMHYRKDIGHTK